MNNRMTQITVQHYVTLMYTGTVNVIRLYDIDVVCFFALQEFPILCQTCLGDNPYIRMVGLEPDTTHKIYSIFTYILLDTWQILFTESLFCGTKKYNINFRIH